MPPVTDNAPQNQDQEGSPVPLQQFKVKLFQIAEVNTEVFDVQAVDESDAMRQGIELIANKDLDDVEHRLEVEVVTPPEPAEDQQSGSESDPNASLGSTADTPTADTTSPHAADNTTGENNAPIDAGRNVAATDPNWTPPTQGQADNES